MLSGLLAEARTNPYARLIYPDSVQALQQYASRLHREHASQTDVRIYDYADQGILWDRRQRGYETMGYIIDE